MFYAGMEMSGVHVREIKNPTVNYPKAVIIGALLPDPQRTHLWKVPQPM